MTRQEPKTATPAFFTMRPLSTGLQSGTIEVTSWDADLTPTTRVFSNPAVDLDALAAPFLAGFDRLMAPSLAAGIARIGGEPGPIDTLRVDRAKVASALAGLLTPVYAEQRAGYPAAAAERFARSLRLELADAYRIAALVQAPLDGGGWLTVPVAVTPPEERRIVVLGEANDASLGGIALPVPLRRHPGPPLLIGQSAGVPLADEPAQTASGDPIEDALRALLRWSLALTIGRQGLAAQDDLWLSTTFNQPLGWQPPAPAGPSPLTPLGAALSRFAIGFASIEPLLDLLEGDGDPRAHKLIDILTALVSDVVAALGAPPTVQPSPATGNSTWVLRCPDLTERILTVFSREEPGAAEPLRFPTINGQSPTGAPTPTPAGDAPDGQPGWVQVDYAFDDSAPNALTVEIASFDLLTTQTVIGGARITRNADFVGPANPALVYRGAALFFPAVLVPSAEVTHTVGPFGGASLAAMLTSILALCAAAGTIVAADRVVCVEIGYSYPLLADAGGEPVTVTVPVLLAESPLGSDPAPLAQAYANQLRQWGEATPLPRDGASFAVSLALFAGIGTGENSQRVPVLRFGRIELTVPAGWPGTE